MQVAAYDGVAWSSWVSFKLIGECCEQSAECLCESTFAERWSGIGLGASGGFEFNYSDPDGDALVKYEIKTSRRAQSFWSNSLRYFDAVGGQEVPLSDLSNLWIRGHFTGIRQSFEIRAYDGEDWSDWVPFTIKTGSTNRVPTVTVSDQSIAGGQTEEDMYRLIKGIDPDGDPIIRYEIKDTVGINNWLMDRTAVDATSGYAFNAKKLNDLFLKADASPSTQTLSVRANDGIAWGPWKNFTLTTTTPPNAKPVIASIADQRLAIDETKNISSLVSASDGDSDVITKYKVKDATGGNSFYVSGSAVVAHPRDYEFNASALSTLSIKGERSGGEQTLQIAAYDGKDWGEWRSFKLITNGLPVVTIDNQTLKFNTLKNISSLVSE